LLDLDESDAPIPIATTTNPTDLAPTWPAISEHYIVWTEWPEYFERWAWGRRLVDKKPVGENFRIAAGGSWITIDRNIAVWNGASFLGDGGVMHAAIVAAELDLPGAKDVGDVDQNGKIDITDAIVLLNYLFLGGPRPRLRPADADLSRSLELTDAVVILEYLFRGGRRPGTAR